MTRAGRCVVQNRWRKRLIRKDDGKGEKILNNTPDRWEYYPMCIIKNIV